MAVPGRLREVPGLPGRLREAPESTTAGGGAADRRGAPGRTRRPSGRCRGSATSGDARSDRGKRSCRRARRASCARSPRPRRRPSRGRRRRTMKSGVVASAWKRASASCSGCVSGAAGPVTGLLPSSRIAKAQMAKPPRAPSTITTTERKNHFPRAVTPPLAHGPHRARADYDRRAVRRLLVLATARCRARCCLQRRHVDRRRVRRGGLGAAREGRRRAPAIEQAPPEERLLEASRTCTRSSRSQPRSSKRNRPASSTRRTRCSWRG